MRTLRGLTGTAVLAAVLLAAAGCGDSADGARAESSTTAPPASTAEAPAGSGAPAPSPAGSAEAAVLAGLPSGPATGTAVLAWSGAGEVRAPFTGECSTAGDTSRLEGQADTAHIRLDAGPDGVQVTMDDAGVSAGSALATGRYDVSGRHLSLAAPLVQDGQSVGSLELEVDCGG